MANYPDPHALGFRHSDRGEHEAGGYCASKSKGRIRGWDDLLDQHLNALDLLVNAATEQGDGWGLTRPVLFEVHHVCELVLKRFLAQRNQGFPKKHELGLLWKKAAPHLPKRITKSDREWIDAFIAEMADLTVDGQDGRFPDVTTDISRKWCCLNVPHLATCAGTLVLILRGSRAVQPNSAESP